MHGNEAWGWKKLGLKCPSTIPKVHKRHCEACNESFEDREKLKEHMNEKHSENSCEICLKSFSTEELVRHVDKYHFCEICEKRVYSKNKHVYEHHREKSHGCKYCTKVFLVPSQLQAHIAQSHVKGWLILEGILNLISIRLLNFEDGGF